MASIHRCEQSDHISKIAHQYRFHRWETVWDANGNLQRRRANPNILFKGDRCAVGDRLRIPDVDERDESRATEDHHVFELVQQTIFLRMRILKDDFSAIGDAEFELTVDGVLTPFTGSTDAMGQLEVELPRQSQHATLVVRIPFDASNDPNAGAGTGSGSGGGSGGGAGGGGGGSGGGAGGGSGGGGAADGAVGGADDNAVGGPVPVNWDLKIGRLNPIMESAPDRWCISGVQQRLNNLALNTGPVDGIRGPNTKAAVAAFQTIFGLTVDELPGQSQTQPKLVEVHDTPDSVLGPAPTPAPAAAPAGP